MFNKDDVVKIFNKEEFDKIPQNKLDDIIQRIYPGEEAILESWEDHFQSQNVPYAVVNVTHPDGKTVTRSIWKERLVEWKKKADN